MSFVSHTVPGPNPILALTHRVRQRVRVRAAGSHSAKLGGVPCLLSLLLGVFACQFLKHTILSCSPYVISYSIVGCDEALARVRDVIREKWADVVERLNERRVVPFTVTNARGEKVVKYRRVARPLGGDGKAALGDLHETETSAQWSCVAHTHCSSALQS